MCPAVRTTAVQGIPRGLERERVRLAGSGAGRSVALAAVRRDPPGTAVPAAYRGAAPGVRRVPAPAGPGSPVPGRRWAARGRVRVRRRDVRGDRQRVGRRPVLARRHGTAGRHGDRSGAEGLGGGSGDRAGTGGLARRTAVPASGGRRRHGRSGRRAELPVPGAAGTDPGGVQPDSEPLSVSFTVTIGDRDAVGGQLRPAMMLPGPVAAYTASRWIQRSPTA